jgi:hypothetical protein
MTAYVGWMRARDGHWVQLAAGASIAACHRQLIDQVRKQALVPLSTAVLPLGQHPEQRPAGVHPDALGVAGGHGAGRGGPGAARASRGAQARVQRQQGGTP